MILCEYCSSKNEDDSLECRKCGAPLPIIELIQEPVYFPPYPTDRIVTGTAIGEDISWTQSRTYVASTDTHYGTGFYCVSATSWAY